GVDLSASGGASSEASPAWPSSPEDPPSSLAEAALVGSSARSSPSPPMLPMTNRSTTSSTAAAPRMMMYSRFSRQNGSSARWAPWKDTASASSSNRSGGYGYWESATAPLNPLARIGAGSTRPGSVRSGDAMAPVGVRGAGIGGAPSSQPVHHRGGGAQRRRLVEQGVQPHVVGDLGQADLLADRALLRTDIAEGAPLQGEDPQIALAELLLARSAGIGGVGHGGHAPRLRRRGGQTAHMQTSLPASLADDWARALAPVEDRLHALGDFLRAEGKAGRGYLPAGDRVLRAFTRPMSEVRVLIVGQDPYPTPGHPIGLSFAVERDVRPLPRSLTNIYTELESDLGIPRASHGDLTA